MAAASAITSYNDGNNSVFFFTVKNAGYQAAFPECANTQRFAVNSTAPHYKELVAQILAAYSTKDPKLDVYFEDTCNY